MTGAGRLSSGPQTRHGERRPTLPLLHRRSPTPMRLRSRGSFVRDGSPEGGRPARRGFSGADSPARRETPSLVQEFTDKIAGMAFTRACAELKIEDLHFHDLRHEEISRLFEAGLSIEKVALVTGHKDWRQLQRYTNLMVEDLLKLQ
jgi:hypothetical protein